MATVALVLLAAAPTGAKPPEPALSRLSLAVDPGAFPISHVVILVMENHAYDSLFGAYCNVNNATQVNAAACNSADTNGGLADGTPPHAWSAGIRKSLTSDKGNVSAFFWPTTGESKLGCSHDWNATQTSLDVVGGVARMDGFAASCGGTNKPMGEWNGNTIPVYWDLAQKFALADNTYSSVTSHSGPNHWYLMAARYPQTSAGFFQGLTRENVTDHHEYLNAANRTPTVQDLLNGTSVSWFFYDWGLFGSGATGYQRAIGCTSSSCTQGNRSAYSLWDPMLGRHETYFYDYPSHFALRYNLTNATTLGAPGPGCGLANVSWVIPKSNQSDHPPADLAQGERFVQQYVDAIEGSTCWSSTAIFVTWDDFGGFYDHVVPPDATDLVYNGAPVQDSLSIRVPMLAISPYTPTGLVVHTELDLTSLLGFVEWRFLGGQCFVGALDCAAVSALESGGGMLSFFPLVGTGAPRTCPLACPPYVYPPSNATYPYPASPPAAAPFTAFGGPASSETD